MDVTTYFLQADEYSDFDQQHCQSNWLLCQVSAQQAQESKSSQNNFHKLNNTNPPSSTWLQNMMNCDVTGSQQKFQLKLDEEESDDDDRFEEESDKVFDVRCNSRYQIGLSLERKESSFCLDKGCDVHSRGSTECQVDNMSSKYTRDATSCYLSDKYQHQSDLHNDLFGSVHSKMNLDLEFTTDLFSSVTGGDVCQTEGHNHRG